jgi:SpoVK/Ycf46/Vps4 family AAA+-type ATPase
VPLRITKEVNYVRLAEQRIKQIEALVASWPHETKAFMFARLNQYSPRSGWVHRTLKGWRSLLYPIKEKRFAILKDPEILTDWQMRFSVSGQTNPLEAWNKILEKEVSPRDYPYLLSLLEKALNDVYVPRELAELFEKLYRSFIRKEYLNDAAIPKAPLLLVVGPSGSGKTATVGKAIEEIIFNNQVLPEIDMDLKREEILADQPIWKTIEEVDPDLAAEAGQIRKLHFYKRLARIPIIRSIWKKRIGRNLWELSEQGIEVDYSIVTPNDYQTALAGEPGNYFKKAMGEPKTTSIRHVEEAHSAFGKAENRQQGVAQQQRTLIDTSNIIIDEIINGNRDCLLIATTDQAHRFDPAIYRRFVEKGRIIDMANFWKSPQNLREVVSLELGQYDICVGSCADDRIPPHSKVIEAAEMEEAIAKVYHIFDERSLKITPAYVRKLVGSIIEIKGGFSAELLRESLLVRKAFELVAKNSYGDLFEKIVDQMDRSILWEEYIGKIKDMFSEMANNCLFYGAKEEKGVVLNGPPGSGKTFLVRAWLSENDDVHDIATSPSVLQDPVNPIEGAVANLEKVYDMAKMIAPTMVFFDEGDSLAPKRSPSGGSPADKLTNKLLNLIDGEIPLNRVFTVLTTNRIDILDPALIRSKRLKVMSVKGHLGKKDIYRLIQQYLSEVAVIDGLDAKKVTQVANGLCNTPADYVAFVEKVLALRSTEYAVLRRLQALNDTDDEAKRKFIKFNFKSLMGILEAIKAPPSIQSELKEDPNRFIHRYDTIHALVKDIADAEAYPLVATHLQSAKNEISQSPEKKGKVQLDEFLEAELSQEPQIGFIVGVGANDVAGMLLPIATSLIYSPNAEKIVVTGAVSSASAAAAELDLAVQMTQQSAQEALTMVVNYFQSLLPRINMTRVIGEYLQPYGLHHQLLSASYNVGGPSAGYALAINTLSTLLHIPVCNDFGITGAPWTKGVKRGEVGGSVIIGGHKKKAAKVLLHLRRMYLPQKNYSDFEPETLYNYWRQDKDVLGVTHFGDLVHEVLWLGPEHHKKVQHLVALRIMQKRKAYQNGNGIEQFDAEISHLRDALKSEMEAEIVRRLSALHRYLSTPQKDPHRSLMAIFEEQMMQPSSTPQRGESIVRQP